MGSETVESLARQNWVEPAAEESRLSLTCQEGRLGYIRVTPWHCRGPSFRNSRHCGRQPSRNPWKTYVMRHILLASIVALGGLAFLNGERGLGQTIYGPRAVGP